MLAAELDKISAAALRALGAEVGRVSAGIGQVRFERPGFLADRTLSVTRHKPRSRQLAEFAAACMDAVPRARLDSASRKAWAGMCAEHAEALAVVDASAQLVHADFNPKNLLVERTGQDGWRIAAVLDWEFSSSGCPYADFPGARTPTWRTW
ncbi:MAG TPA: phosphotransferase [Streptosporangiaceae bacterium]|nr:phosphotransferase [Streptosporangiaceae bacterium]